MLAERAAPTAYTVGRDISYVSLSAVFEALHDVGVLSCHCRCGTLNLLGSRQVGALEYGHWLAPVDDESLSPRIISRASPDGFPSHSLQRLSGFVIRKAG